MRNRSYTAAEIQLLESVIGEMHPYLGVGDFSAGRWWGFNGVRRLVLTQDHLYVVRLLTTLSSSVFPISRGHQRVMVERVMPTAEIRRVDWFETDQKIRLTVTTSEHLYRWVSKYLEGRHLAERLDLMITRS